MKKIDTFFGRLSKKKMLLLTALALTGSTSLMAQTDIARYQFAQSTSTYTPITGGTVLVAANVNYDDLNSPAITIPALSYGGATITTVYVNSNGYVTFGAAHSSSTYTPLSSSGTSITGVVSALGCDHGYGSGGGTTGATSEIRYEQVGNEFVAQFQDVKRWASTNERISFQIRLNSATGEIKIVYGGPIVIGNSTGSPEIGIRGNSTTWASNVNNLRLLDVPSGTTCNWSNAVTGNASGSNYTMTSANAAMVPTPGLTYTWTPAATVAPVRTFSAVTNITGTGATLNFTAPTGATQYNVQYRVPGTCAWTNYAGNPVTATSSIVLTGLPSATTLQVRVQSSNGSNNAIWSHVPNQAGTGDGYTTTGTFTTLCGTPVPGLTIATPNSNLCANAPVAFSLTTQTPGGGVTYQWQSSNDNVSYNNISGATSATYNGPATARYYRCMVRCSAGPDSTASGPIQLTYNSSITNSTPAQRCGNGTVVLTAAGSAGATLNWYSAATGGTPIGTGSPFTTPVINATTNFYVGAETIASGLAIFGTGTSAIGTTSYPNPLSAYYGGAKHQLLFLASELQAQGLVAGNITTVSFDVAAINTSGICQDFTIRMGSTTATSLSGFVTGTVPVYNATFTPSTTGIVTFTLSTPFPWNGSSNIILETVHNAGNSGNGSGTTTRYTTTPFNSVFVRYADGVTPSGVASFDAYTAGGTTISADRPNVRLGGQVVCSSPRVAVTATVNTPPTFTVTANQTVCNNAITTLAVTSALSNFNTYTWTPATNLYTDAAATVPYIANANASTVYLKSNTAGTVTYTANANNSTTQCAAVTTSAVTILPATVTAIATPAAICVSGSTTLALVPATGYGAGSFQWQSAPDNIGFVDINSATSNTYTTPVVSTNTYYRAVIKNSAGAVCLNTVSDTARVYNPLVASTTPGARCGTGTVTLGATATEGTLSWYAAATGGAALGTGTSFTTPSISANTTYYVGAAAGGTAGVATIGAGASTSVSGNPDYSGTSPYAYHYGNYKHQMLILASELQAAGVTAGSLTSVAFDVVTAGSPIANFNNFNISLIPTSQTVMATAFATGGTNVFSAASVTPAVGINTYTFPVPFPWDGTSNIIVQTCYNNNNSGVVGSSAEVKYDVTPFVSHTIFRADGTQNSVCSEASGSSNNDGPAMSKRPKMVFGYNGACQSPRVAVIASVNPIPTITVTPSGTVQICAGSTTTLTATGGGNYQWRNAAGNINGQTNNTFTTGTAGTYKVVVTTPATGCRDSSAAITVNVNPLPTVFIGNDTTFCSGNSLTLNAGNTGAAFLWNNGSTNQTRTVNTTGSYWVKVTNSNGCAKTDTIQVTVNPTPVVNLGNDTNLCLGVNYVLNAGNPGAAKLWDNGTTGQTRTVSATGTYYVRVTNSFNCVARDTVTTTFLTSPVVNLGNDQDVCAGATVTLDAGNPGDTYLWDNGSTLQTRSVTTSGNYYVTVRNIANCKGSDTVQVTVHPLPVVNLGNDTTFCHGNTLVLNAGNPGATYLWSDYSTAQTLAVNSTGNYGVTVTDVYSCVGSDNINILVKDLPSGIINAVHGDTATYTFNVLNAQYVTACTWNFGDGSPVVTVNNALTQVHHRYTQNGIFSVSVKLHGECNDSLTTTRTVDVYDAGGTTGIGQLENSKDLVLYPNPAKDLVVIENKHNLRMNHITVYNVVGQVMTNVKADSDDKHLLHTATYASGIYTVRIDTDKGIVIRKFEIMK